VIVSDFVDGRGFEEIKQLPQAERDRLGEIVFRFYFGCMYRHHQFSGDPHPGNSLLLKDGRMAFLDFGLFKRIPAEIADRELQMIRWSVEGDAEALAEGLRGSGFVLESARYTPEQLLEQFRDLTWWYSTDEEITLESEIATQVMIDMSDPRSRHFAQMRHESLPPDHLFGRRLEVLTLAVLGQLRARANWYGIASEWIHGAAPQTELGRQEMEFLARRD
jgi:predicted unusual protein kinase regulating ubiquinone biosynthesis (AarF/ABC1/UbiB family)